MFSGLKECFLCGSYQTGILRRGVRHGILRDTAPFPPGTAAPVSFLAPATVPDHSPDHAPDPVTL